MEEAAPVRFDVVNIEDILKTLPHRYPMLLIDRVINIRADYSGVGIKNVTFNEPCFLGHFPDRPVYPGVMMIEAMAQTAGVMLASAVAVRSDSTPLLAAVNRFKFLKPVAPGAALRVETRKLTEVGPMAYIEGTVSVQGEIVAKGELSVVG